jgi:vacuolar-type H+-ATPase subunit C/Vma6
MNSPRWEDLATRARGLGTHLLDRSAIASLAAAENVAALGSALRGYGYPIPEGALTADDLELAARRHAGRRLSVLARWAGHRSTLLAVIFEDEDRRSIRALVRGAVQGAPSDLRLAGLIPTPALPERALRELALQPSPGAIAVLLTAWGNAYGTALLRDANATQPDLLALESGLNVTFARRALDGARGTGSALVIDYVRDTIDLENATAALILTAGEADSPGKTAFVEGGRRLSLGMFLEAIAAGDAGAAGRRLAAVFRPTPLAAAFERAADASGIEEQLLRARIVMIRDVERRDSAGPASVLGFALRVRAEVFEVRHAIWSIVLGAPRGSLAGAAVAAGA